MTDRDNYRKRINELLEISGGSPRVARGILKVEYPSTYFSPNAIATYWRNYKGNPATSLPQKERYKIELEKAIQFVGHDFSKIADFLDLEGSQLLKRCNILELNLNEFSNIPLGIKRNNRETEFTTAIEPRSRYRIGQKGKYYSKGGRNKSE